MAERSRFRRLAVTVVVMLAAAGGSYLAATSFVPQLSPLTPKQARCALARQFPQLADAEISEFGGRVYIGDFACDLGKGTWERQARPETAGQEFPAGHFERWPSQHLGRWRTVETRRWTVVAVDIRVP